MKRITHLLLVIFIAGTFIGCSKTEEGISFK